MDEKVLHLHTHFLFPFSIDVEAVKDEHPEIWGKDPRWINGLDAWISRGGARTDSPITRLLGGWRRAPYERFDLDSRGYQDLVFFHPFTRRVFFDVAEAAGKPSEYEALIRSYRIPPRKDVKISYEAQDLNGGSASVDVSELRMFLFANGIGILSIGVEAFSISAAQALWINEALRKVYPSSGRQVREGRVPSRTAFVIETGGTRTVAAEHDFSHGAMISFLPPLASTITSLLYFANYADEEYEPVLDERMIVYSYMALDPEGLPPDYAESQACQVLLSRFLYVDRAGEDYRYEREFIRREMRRQVYSRWAHRGTFYGFTSYSGVTMTIGTFDCDAHRLREGFLIHRMFDTRYYIMALVALFYRATLLDFSERVALVSKRLYLDQWHGRFHTDNIRLTDRVRADFLHFSTHWYFDELANKDEEIEHFQLQCRQYRTEVMRQDIERELDALNLSLHNYFQFRNTEAVNRLAMLSMILGAGAVVTGFFGMNFEHWFAETIFRAEALPAVHWAAIGAVSVLAFGALAFGIWTVAANWHDYRNTLLPGRSGEGGMASRRLRRPGMERGQG